MSVKVLFAYRKEQKMHSRFSCSRFTWTKRVKYGAWGQNHMKIGIATNMQSRLKTINKDPDSGKTEWFALTWLEVLFVMGWMYWYKARPYVNAAGIIILLIVIVIIVYC